MTEPRKYRVLRQREINGAVYASPGDIVYDCVGYDYGSASDDTDMTGVEHQSVTISPQGDYPFFTIPSRDLESFP